MHTGGAEDGARVSLCHSKAQEGKLYERSSDVTVDPLHRRERNKTQLKIWLNYIFEDILFFLKTIEKKSTLKRKMYLNKKIIPIL